MKIENSLRCTGVITIISFLEIKHFKMAVDTPLIPIAEFCFPRRKKQNQHAEKLYALIMDNR